MNRPQQGRNNQRRRNGAQKSSGRSLKADIWRTPEALPPLEHIAVSRDATALLRSLGEPPMNGALEAGYTFGAVVERGAGIAAALALSADLLAASGE